MLTEPNLQAWAIHWPPKQIATYLYEFSNSPWRAEKSSLTPHSPMTSRSSQKPTCAPWLCPYEASASASTPLSDAPSNEEKQWIQVNPSCLLAYLGIRGYANTPKSGEAVVNKNALPILTYFDIFKNYYANTQEENFYMIGGSPSIKVQIDGENIPNNDDIPSALGGIT